MGREKEEKRNPQEPKPLISTPEVTWSTARAGGPCRAPTPGVMSRWNRDIRPGIRGTVVYTILQPRAQSLLFICWALWPGVTRLYCVYLLFRLG